jgi:hypothetical protein
MKLIFILCFLVCLSSSVLSQQQSTVLSSVSPGTLNLQWLGVPYRTYFVQHSSDLQAWVFFPNLILQGEGISMSTLVSSTADQYFFRLKYTDEPSAAPSMADFDGDGVSTWHELQILGTDPLVTNTDGLGANDGGGDSDNDGLPDALELYFFSNLTAQSGSGDPDADGLSNIEELALLTSPVSNESAAAANRSNFFYDLLGRLAQVSGQQTAVFIHDPEGSITSAQ